MSKYTPLFRALMNSDMRKKLRAICAQLEEHKNTGDFYYGCGNCSESFDTVKEMLEVLK